MVNVAIGTRCGERRRFARHSTYVDARTCAFYRSREDGSVIIIWLPQNGFVIPPFVVVLSKTRVGYGMMVSRGNPSIFSSPFFFFLKVKRKVFTTNRNVPSNLSNRRKDTLRIVPSRAVREMELAAFARDECK